MCISPQRRAIFRHLNFQKWSEPTVFCTFWLANMLFATAAYNFSASELPKVVPDRQFFNIFTSECAFRHSGVQFFDIWTSKSGPGPSVFWHFYFRMCFSPQRRAIFQHLNFQKWSRTLSFLTFLLPNVLFATAACNFWCHLSAPTSAPAALTGLLLDWPDTRIYEKTQHFVTSVTFGAHVSSFLLTFWLLHLLSTDLTTLLLLFNSPYCRKFLFKLPSINTFTDPKRKLKLKAGTPKEKHLPTVHGWVAPDKRTSTSTEGTLKSSRIVGHHWLAVWAARSTWAFQQCFPNK